MIRVTFFFLQIDFMFRLARKYVKGAIVTRAIVARANVIIVMEPYKYLIHKTHIHTCIHHQL